MSITTIQQTAVSNYLFGGVTVSSVSPASYYIGLATGSVAQNGTIIGEVVGGGYARVQIPNNKISFSTSSVNGLITNLIDFSFPQSETAWGDITTVFISETPISGTALYAYTLPIPRNIQDNVTVLFRGDPSGVNGDLQFEVL